MLRHSQVSLLRAQLTSVIVFLIRRSTFIGDDQGGYWSTPFTSQDAITNLCYIFRASGKQESMRLTAGF
uniref:Uncharacterized protein n=1 Tax=Solanum lycopersicum TaxID=4081 RepID=K4BZH1_SOLLC